MLRVRHPSSSPRTPPRGPALPLHTRKPSSSSPMLRRTFHISIRCPAKKKSSKAKEEPVEEVTFDIDTTAEEMKNHVERLQRELSSVNTGRANPTLLEKVQVDAYGNNMPLQRVGQVAVKGPQLLVVNVFDKNLVKKVERAIASADLGFNPSSSGNMVHVPIPKLTKDVRDKILRKMAQMAESAKSKVRTERKDARAELKKLEKTSPKDEVKRLEKELQETTDKYVKEADEVLSIATKNI